MNCTLCQMFLFIILFSLVLPETLVHCPKKMSTRTTDWWVTLQLYGEKFDHFTHLSSSLWKYCSSRFGKKNTSSQDLYIKRVWSIYFLFTSDWCRKRNIFNQKQNNIKLWLWNFTLNTFTQSWWVQLMSASGWREECSSVLIGFYEVRVWKPELKRK